MELALIAADPVRRIGISDLASDAFSITGVIGGTKRAHIYALAKTILVLLRTAATSVDTLARNQPIGSTYALGTLSEVVPFGAVFRHADALPIDRPLSRAADSVRGAFTLKIEIISFVALIAIARNQVISLAVVYDICAGSEP